jgi:hypothetical protein
MRQDAERRRQPSVPKLARTPEQEANRSARMRQVFDGERPKKPEKRAQELLAGQVKIALEYELVESKESGVSSFAKSLAAIGVLGLGLAIVIGIVEGSGG